MIASINLYLFIAYVTSATVELPVQQTWTSAHQIHASMANARMPFSSLLVGAIADMLAQCATMKKVLQVAFAFLYFVRR